MAGSVRSARDPRIPQRREGFPPAAPLFRKTRRFRAVPMHLAPAIDPAGEPIPRPALIGLLGMAFARDAGLLPRR